MNCERLNEHDANCGAQSTGEFLGMTGNSAWYLLGAAGASVLLTILLWGMLGFSLLVCLAAGLTLCGLALAYVFTLKNNRPDHYDSDFFESVLIEAGVLALVFGAREKRPSNPFRTPVTLEENASDARGVLNIRPDSRRRGAPQVARARQNAVASANPAMARTGHPNKDEARMVPLAAFERVQNDLSTTEDMLEDALAAREEEGVCD